MSTVYANPRHAQERELLVAQQRFETAQREWLTGRDEYKAVCAFLKARREDDEHGLDVVCAAAGVTVNERCELARLRDRAVRVLPIAQDHSTRQKTLGDIEKQWAELCAAYDNPPSIAEREKAEDSLRRLEGARNAAQEAVAQSRSAVETVAEAKRVGLI